MNPSDEQPTTVMDPGGQGGYGGSGQPPYGEPGSEYPDGGDGGNKKFLWVLLAILAAIAIAGAVAFALGDDDDAAKDKSTTTTEETTEPDPEPTTVTETETETQADTDDDTGPPDVENPELFRLPDADIHCTMEEMAVSCDVADFEYSPPAKPGDCSGDWGGRISLGTAQAGFVCYSDALPSTDTDVELGHGMTSTVGDFACTSEGDAVYCINNATGFNFSVSPDAYQFLDGPS